MRARPAVSLLAAEMDPNGFAFDYSMRKVVAV